MELILIAAGLLVGAALAYGLAKTWRNVSRDTGTQPLLLMLDLHGRSPAQVEGELGPEGMALALRRCVFCSAGDLCRQRAAAAQSMPDYCPNAGFIAHACNSRTT